jgi:oxygen-dependent protoporphyrinogen oxidase
MSVQTIIIGGGITGLCTGNLLLEQDSEASFILLEAADDPGGTARTDAAEGFTCDWGPNGFLDREPLTLEWIEGLGLSGDLIRANEAAARRFIYKSGALHEILPPPGFLFSPLLSVAGRARLLCEPLIPAKRNGEPESIWSFAARRIGREAADTLVSCMVSGVHGGDAKQLSLEHCFPRMAAMEREYGGLFKALQARRKASPGASPMGPGGTLTSFPEGMGTLTRKAAERLGDRVRFGQAVTTLDRTGTGYRIETEAGETFESERVVLAAPAYVAATLLAGFDEELASSLSEIQYAPLAVLSVGYARDRVQHDLNGFGFLSPRNQGLRVLGSIWTSSVFPDQAAEGHVLFRTMYGGATDPDAINLTDSELVQLFNSEVAPLMEAEPNPDFVRVFRHARGIPQYGMRHGTIIEAIEAGEQRNPGLILAGNAYRGIGVNDCVVSAHRAVNLLR